MAFIKRLYRLLIIPYLDIRQKPSFSIFLSEYRKEIEHNTHFLVKKLDKCHMYLNIINTFVQSVANRLSKEIRTAKAAFNYALVIG